MKVYLATQLLSRSVATSLEYCRDILKLDEFRNCGATVTFIKIVNDCFDILNSRSLKAFDYQVPINKSNIEKINEFTKSTSEYISKLRFLNGEYIIYSNRSRGFMGFLLGLQAVRNIYNRYIHCSENNTNLLSFLPTYKCSQDHLEHFFSHVRDMVAMIILLADN